MQEVGATSSHVAEPATEIHKTAKETVSVEQGQPLRAAEPHQCVLRVKTQRQRVILEFTHSLLSSWCAACVYGKAADDLHRRRRDSDLEDALFERTEMAAVTEPRDVTEYLVRVSGDRLDVWRFGVCSLKGQSETAASTLHDIVDTTRRAKNNTTRYSNDSLGCEEVEKQETCFHFPHVESRTTNATATDVLYGRLHNAQSTLRSTRHSSSGRTRTTAVKSGNSPTGFWFRSVAQTSKLEEQRTEAHLLGKLNRANEQLIVIKGLTRSAGAGRKQVREETWNLGSAKAASSRIPGPNANTDIDTSVARQEYITNQALDEHGCTTRYTRGDGDTEAHCRNTR